MRPLGTLFTVMPKFMVRSVKVKPKKRRRPATGRQPFVGVRLPRSLISEIEKWTAAQGVGVVSGSEAIRRLVELGLAGLRPIPRRSAEAAAKASDMAAKQIDKLADASATNEERQQRKRRLLKGPREFRDVREDVAKHHPTLEPGKLIRENAYAFSSSGTILKRFVDCREPDTGAGH